jgi:hypothetical protein
MSAGKGYRVFVNYYSNSLHKFDTKGSLVRNDFTFPALTRSVFSVCSPATYNCNLNLTGWNLLANPYPCPIDWNAAAGWTKPADMNNAFYTWNSLSGGYRAYNGTLAVDLGVTVNSGALPNIIPSSQAFFVRLMSGSSASLVVKEAAKVTNASGTFLRTATADASMIHMRLKKNGVSDYHFDAMVRFEEGSSEEFDIHKDMDLLPGPAFEFGFPAGGSNMVLNSQSVLTEETRIVPLSVDLKGQSGSYAFEILAQNLPVGATAFIRDNLLGEIAEIHPGSIVEFLSYDEASAYSGRFELLINPVTFTGNTVSPGSEIIRIFPNPTQHGQGTLLTLQGFSGREAAVRVADMAGRTVLNQKFTLQNENHVFPINCSGLAAGIYTIQVCSENRKITRKLVVK